MHICVQLEDQRPTAQPLDGITLQPVHLISSGHHDMLNNCPNPQKGSFLMTGLQMLRDMCAKVLHLLLNLKSVDLIL